MRRRAKSNSTYASTSYASFLGTKVRRITILFVEALNYETYNWAHPCSGLWEFAIFANPAEHHTLKLETQKSGEVARTLHSA